MQDLLLPRPRAALEPGLAVVIPEKRQGPVEVEMVRMVIVDQILDSLRLFSRHEAGTHTIYVGKVQASSVPGPDEPPLVYWNRGYRQLRLWDHE